MLFADIPMLIYSQKCSVFATTSGFWYHFSKIVQTFIAIFPLFYPTFYVFSEQNQGAKIPF